jgi:hypothetical protein
MDSWSAIWQRMNMRHSRKKVCWRRTNRLGSRSGKPHLEELLAIQSHHGSIRATVGRFCAHVPVLHNCLFSIDALYHVARQPLYAMNWELTAESRSRKVLAYTVALFFSAFRSDDEIALAV